jgi:hypothetical protein
VASLTAGGWVAAGTAAAANRRDPTPSSASIILRLPPSSDLPRRPHSSSRPNTPASEPARSVPIPDPPPDTNSYPDPTCTSLPDNPSVIDDVRISIKGECAACVVCREAAVAVIKSYSTLPPGGGWHAHPPDAHAQSAGGGCCSTPPRPTQAFSIYLAAWKIRGPPPAL